MRLAHVVARYAMSPKLTRVLQSTSNESVTMAGASWVGTVLQPLTVYRVPLPFILRDRLRYDKHDTVLLMKGACAATIDCSGRNSGLDSSQYKNF
jgi:hypothetical protein